jgi:hypothetical protein
MCSARVSVAPIAFSQAMTCRGALSVERASIPLAMTGAMNLRMLGPTEQVTMSAVRMASTRSCSCVLELMAL